MALWKHVKELSKNNTALLKLLHWYKEAFLKTCFFSSKYVTLFFQTPFIARFTINVQILSIIIYVCQTVIFNLSKIIF